LEAEDFVDLPSDCATTFRSHTTDDFMHFRLGDDMEKPTIDGCAKIEAVGTIKEHLVVFEFRGRRPL
jgi:hypothetical protein